MRENIAGTSSYGNKKAAQKENQRSGAFDGDSLGVAGGFSIFALFSRGTSFVAGPSLNF